MIHEYKEFEKFANVLADEASKITNSYFRKKINIENKEDESPVTIADKNTELKIRDLISNKYPSHGILGEEYGNNQIESEYIWVIDPIDGTRSFIAGHKDFGTLISLLHNNKPVIGIINCPAHNERWIGVRGQKTTLNNKIIETSKITNINEAYLFTSGIYFHEPILKKGYKNIKEKCKYYRLGGDCYMYGMLASGLIDIVIEDTLKAHDYMALVNVIEGAGGKITDKYGKDVTIESDGSLIASCNSTLHNKLISIINN
ncbi:MAG: histidinol phosphate phosphatase [Gammaproteobacteria bacterium]|nr:histidinol phosphate phosphatase [Gammaproteobacteria bacterium]